MHVLGLLTSILFLFKQGMKIWSSYKAIHLLPDSAHTHKNHNTNTVAVLNIFKSNWGFCSNESVNSTTNTESAEAVNDNVQEMYYPDYI